MKLPTPSGVEAALENIRPYISETPLVRSEILSRGLGADVWLKNETVSPIASFKLRGTLNDLIQANANGEIERVVTASSGNHGQAVAYGARLLGLRSDIFLPEQANPVKAAMVQAFEATIHRFGRDSRELKAEAKRFAAEHGYYFIDDGESLELMEGAGTVGLEIARNLDAIDTVYVPVGDGALISGISCAVKALHPAAKIVSVQAEGAPGVTHSFLQGKVVAGPEDTIADGLANREPGEFALAAVLEFVDDAILVSDEALLAAMHTLMESAHVLVEPSGAAALAAAWAQRGDIKGQHIVLVLTGANVPMDVVSRALATPPLFPIQAAVGD